MTSTENIIQTALNAATVDMAPGTRAHRATYTRCGASAMGYGVDEAAARANLAENLAFNLEHNGSLV